MRRWKQSLALFLTAAMVCTLLPVSGREDRTKAETKQEAGETVNVSVEDLLIDGATANTTASMAYRGMGAVSCNNSSRLLMDYKEENPKAYWEIMNWLFHPENGAGLTHVKVELGCDLDTSSGAEPATKRTEDEPANVARGAGFMFAHDAQTINPAITVELLRWGEPGWIDRAKDANGKVTRDSVYAARYRWIKETIDAAYQQYGMKINYIGAAQNERGVSFPLISKKGEIDDEKDNVILWTIYLADALKQETAGLYDYSTIQITAADQVDTNDLLRYLVYDRDIADGNIEPEGTQAAEDKKCELAKQLRDAIAVVGIHYDLNLKKTPDDIRRIELLTKEYGKEFWHAEGSPSMTSAENGKNATNEGSDMTGAGGVLNVANRMIASYCNNSQTLYEYQPSVAAYYDGVVYFPKQIMTANTPWSGYYSIDACMPMTMHFTSFMKQGWQYIDSGCKYDGETSGHNCGETRSTYLTAADAKTGDYSTVITNDSATERTYRITVKNLAKASAALAVWETRQADEGLRFDANWLKQVATVTPADNGDGSFTYQITVKPYSMITLTTTTGQKDYATRASATAANDKTKDMVLGIPYADNFEYDSEYIKRRGGTPRYTTDLNGAFEVAEENGNHFLRQMITKDTEPTPWGGMEKYASTSLGEDRWSNYTVSVDVRFDANPKDRKKNYVELAARYNTYTTKNGYWLRLYQTGEWQVYDINGKKASSFSLPMNYVSSDVNDGIQGEIKLEEGAWNNLSLTVNGRELIAKINGEIVCAEVLDKCITASGRIGLASSYNNNDFDNLSVTPVGETIAYDTDIIDMFTDISVSNFAYDISSYYKSMIRPVTQGAVSVTRIDDLSSDITFSPEWERLDSQGYVDYGRTISTTSQKGAAMSYTFRGTGIHILGYNRYAKPSPVVSIVLDGQLVEDSYKILEADHREALLMIDGLADKEHKIEITLCNKGKLTIDAIEVLKQSSAVGSPSVSEAFYMRDYISLDLAGKKNSELNTVLFPYGREDDITYVSSNNAVSVDAKGRIKAKKAGIAKITATTASGYSKSCMVVVEQSPKSIKAKDKKITLKKGKKATLQYKLTPKIVTNDKVKFKSSNRKVAKVDKKGVVTAKKAGSCIITLTTANKKTAKVKVTVK